MPTIRSSRSRGLRIVGGAASMLLAPGIVSADWGSSNWGTLVWGAGGGTPLVPALGLGGSVVLVAGILITGSWLVKARARRRDTQD